MLNAYSWQESAPQTDADAPQLPDVAGPWTRTDSAGREQGAESDDWDDPEPIPPPLLPVPAFDAEALLPTVLRTWVMDETNRMHCPPEFIAAAVLAEAGSVIGARIAIRPKSLDHGWFVVPNMWGGVVGRPSTMKTPSLSAALSPLGRLVAAAEKEHATALALYEDQAAAFKARTEALDVAIKAAAKSERTKPKTTQGKADRGEDGDLARAVAELRKLKESAPEPPKPRRFKSNDATIEKLGELLRDNPNGLLVYRDEICGLLTRWESRDGQEERTFFLEAWNGKQSFDTDRIGRGRIHIPNHCLSVFGGIQPAKLLEHLRTQRENNDGMFQRFGLLVFPDETGWEWSNIPANDRAKKAAFDVFDELASFDPIAWGAEPATDFVKFPTLAFDEESQALFVEWLTELRTVRIPSEPNPLVQEHLGKYDGLFCQLALTFHCIERATGGARIQVGIDSAMLAAAWCEFLEAHARRVYGLLQHDGFEGAYQLSLKITEGAVGDGFTARDIRRNRWRALATADEVDDAIRILVKREWIRPHHVGGTGPGSGRPTNKYDINPTVKFRGGDL